MPELPEVETMCRGIRPIVGQTVRCAQLPPCERKPIVLDPSIGRFDRLVRGQTVRQVDRLGKRVLIMLSGRDTIVIEPRMTGLVLIGDPPGREHLRLRLVFRDGDPGELLFWDRRGLGTIRLLSESQLQTGIRDRLGPDALGITAAGWKQRLGGSRRSIKVAMLDQSRVAGIGNLYAAEILFVAGIDPRAGCDRLSMPQWNRIAAATTAVLTDAITHEGSTLSDGTYRTALNADGNYQNHHRVYDRAGQRCRRCPSGIIRRLVQAQRSTFFCPNCQRRSGRHPAVAADLEFAGWR